MLCPFLFYYRVKNVLCDLRGWKNLKHNLPQFDAHSVGVQSLLSFSRRQSVWRIQNYASNIVCSCVDLFIWDSRMELMRQTFKHFIIDYFSNDTNHEICMCAVCDGAQKADVCSNIWILYECSYSLLKKATEKAILFSKLNVRRLQSEKNALHINLRWKMCDKME